MKILNITVAFILLVVVATGAMAQLAPEDTMANSNANIGISTYDKNKKAKATVGGMARANAWNRSAVRPSHVNNAMMKYYPPVFAQDQGSCSYASFFGYTVTWEINSYYGRDGSLEENQLPTHFSFLYPASTGLANNTGMPTVTDYGGRTYSKLFGPQAYLSNDNGWMQGYDKWYRTAFNRTSGMSRFSHPINTEEGREELKNWLWNHCGDNDFNAGGVARFTMAGNGETFDEIPATTTNRSIGLAGKKYIVDWGPTTNHSQTIVGYDDRIEFDLDSNGVYGEKDKDECGAWIVCNSWGQGWCNGGMVYCPYARAFTSSSRSTLWTITVHHIKKDYKPLRMLKVKMEYSKRSLICVSVGASEDTAATEPQVKFTLEHMKYTGNRTSKVTPYPEVPMLGRWIDGMHYEPMEFGQDVTVFTDNIDRRKPVKYFLQIQTKDIDDDESNMGEGKLHKVSLIDYELDPNGIEFPFNVEGVKITGKNKLYTVSVVVPGEQLNEPDNLRATSEGELVWDKPSMTSIKVAGYRIYSNGALLDEVSADANSYKPATIDDNIYTVASLYNYRGNLIESKPSNGASFDKGNDDGNNYVIDFHNAQAIAENFDFRSTPNATLEMWIKPRTMVNYNNVVGNPNNLYVGTKTSKGICAGQGFKPGDIMTVSKVVNPEEWNHIAVTVNNDSIKAYINGVRVNRDNLNWMYPVGNIGEFYLGYDYENGMMDAEVDEIRMWRRTLTPHELNTLSKVPLTHPEQQEGLYLYYKGDTFVNPIDGNTYIRDHAKGHHARIINADSVKSIVDNTLFDSEELACNIIIPEGSIFKGDVKQFSSLAAMAAKECEWSLDGEMVSTLVAPKISFTTAGEHNISLKVTSPQGTTKSAQITLDVQEPPMPVADFEIAANNLPANDYFSFINHSKGINCTYHWSMPGADVEEQDATNAMARFLEVGSYPVTLTVTNAAGSSSVTKTITAVASAPAPYFSVEPSTILLGDKVYFTDKTLYGPKTWLWEINHTNGKHNYVIHAQNTAFTPQAPGRYNLTLKCSNEQGTTSSTQKMAFAVSNADPGNGLSFSGGSETLAIPTNFSSTIRNLSIDTWIHPFDLNGALAFASEDGVFCTKPNADGSLSLTFNGKTQSSAAGYIIANEWHHYAITLSAGTVKFYRDAELFSQPSGKVALTSPAIKGSIYLSSKETPFMGIIDELRIWSKTISATQIKAMCNQPMTADEIATAKASQGLLAYYQFNQSSGDAIDASGNEMTATRIGFGPDGDAWGPSLGVFTLDFEGDSKSDVTDEYLTNPRAPFLSTGNAVSVSNSTYNLELLTDDDKSKWQIGNAVVTEKATTGAYVNKAQNNDLNFRTGYYGFADTLMNHTLYQTVTLPAGYYTLTVSPGASGAFTADSSYICAVIGDEFVDMTNFETKSEAYASLKDTVLTFTVGEEQEVTLGLIVNIKGWTGIDISGFKLERTPVTVVEPDDETSVYETVEHNPQNKYTPMANAIRVIHPTKERLRIYNLEGILQFDEDVEGVHILPFHPGIYIVNDKKLEVR